MIKSAKVDKILKSVEQLKPLPGSISRVLQATDDPQTNSSILSEIIGLDQALSAKVLQMANSASLGYGPGCSTLSDAVMRLGFKRIRTIVLGIGASSPLTKRLSGYRLGAGQLWTHSVSASTAAQWIARHMSYPEPEEAYVAGLLHDIGKLLLDQFILVDYQQIMYSVRIQKKMLCEAEEELIGINHAKVGSLMAEKWNFPTVLVEAIKYHHTPSLAFEGPILAAIVNVSNAFASENTKDLDPKGMIVHPESYQILNLEERTLEKLKTEMDQYFKLTSS